jgi:hypothetical protein
MPSEPKVALTTPDARPLRPPGPRQGREGVHDLEPFSNGQAQGRAHVARLEAVTAFRAASRTRKEAHDLKPFSTDKPKVALTSPYARPIRPSGPRQGREKELTTSSRRDGRRTNGPIRRGFVIPATPAVIPLIIAASPPPPFLLPLETDRPRDERPRARRPRLKTVFIRPSRSFGGISRRNSA